MKIAEGDILEIDTPKGKAYLHYIYKDKTIGELVRVLSGLFSQRPNTFDEVANRKERYMIFFPLSFACKKNIVRFVSHYPADNFRKPKYMRDRHVVRGEFKGWNIVDTDTWKNTLVQNLDENQKQLSPWGVWNDTLLIERLAKDWSLEEWDQLPSNGE